MNAAIKSFTILRSIGQSPFGDEPNTVKGEETDSVVTAAGLGLIGLVALAAVGSAGTSKNVSGRRRFMAILTQL